MVPNEDEFRCIKTLVLQQHNRNNDDTIIYNSFLQNSFLPSSILLYFNNVACATAGFEIQMGTTFQSYESMELATDRTRFVFWQRDQVESTRTEIAYKQ